MSHSQDIAKMEARLRVLTEANWNRQQQLMYMEAACSSLEFARMNRLLGRRAAAAMYLSRTVDRLQLAVSFHQKERSLIDA